MTPEVLAALRRVVAGLGADGGVLLRPTRSGACVVVSSTLEPALAADDRWGPGGSLGGPDVEPELVTDPERLAHLVPAGVLRAMSGEATAALMAPLGDSRLRMVLFWAGTPAPADVTSAMRSEALRHFTALAPLLDAQVRAHESAIRLRAVASALDQAVVVTVDGDVRANINAAAARLLGLRPGSVDGEALSAAMGALRERSVDPVALAVDVARLRASTTEVARDWVWHLHGSPSHLRVTSVPVENAPGGGRVWVFDDVSAEVELVENERRAAQALAESEERYRVLAENVSDVVIMGAPDGTLTWVSPSVTTTLGWSPDDLVGRQVPEFVRPDHLEVLQKAIERVQRGESATFEAPIRTAGGDFRWMEVRGRLLVDDDGRVFGRVAALWDVQAAHDAREALERHELIAGQALAQSEERYRLLAENVSDVVMMGDLDGVLTWASPSVRATLGWSPEELLGTRVVDFVRPDRLGVLVEGLERVDAGERVTFEVPIRTAGGDYRWMEMRAKLLLDDQDRVVGRVAALWDVQATHDAREQLARSERRYQLLLDNTTEVVFQTVDGVVTWVSPAVEEVTGWRPADIIGTSSQQLWHPDDWERASWAHDVARTGVHGREVLRLATRGGDYRWMEVVIRPYVEPDGRPGTVGMLYDVTDRVLAQEAARASEERYRIVAERATDVVVRYGTDGIIDWAFGSTEAMVGYLPAELVGRPVIDLMVRDDVPDPAEVRARLVAGETVEMSVRLRHADGGSRWAALRGTGVFDDQGVMQSVVATWRDAHAEVEYREALATSERQARDLVAAYEAARDEAVRASTAKTAFLSRMSHELRTPLNAVLGFAQLLALDPLTAEQAEAVQHIRTGGRHLLDLINEIVDISRIEAGRLSLSMETVDSEAVQAEAVELVQPLAQEHDVVVEVAGADQPVADVHADRQRTTQVLLNLVSNAVKYNRPGGSVRVACRPGGPGEVAFEVSDTGPGIPPDLLPRLFEPFDRLGAENSDVEGTGIGLALADALARAMGGRIEVSTTVGTGSTFTLVLRASPSDAARSGPERHEPGSHPDSRLRILYVEDNPTNATLMARVVALRPGSRLQVAVDGNRGIAAAMLEPPDLVFLDLHLPDMPGEAVLEQLRLLPGLAEVPVVVVTADASPSARERMVALGSDGFLTKPLDLDHVLGWIDATAAGG